MDTLTGGTGGDDLFLAEGTTGASTIGSLAAGSSVTGNGTGNSLVASGDLTGVTISGIQTLETGSAIETDADTSITLTHAQFTGFTAIEGGGAGYVAGEFTLNAKDGGTFNLSSKDPASTDQFSMTALSNAGTTLIDNDGDQELLTASATGNDTLQAGDGFEDKLIAGAGNDALTAGNGIDDTLIAGAGTDTLTAGNGNGDTLQAGTGAVTMTAGTGTGDTFVASDGLASGSSVTAGGSGAILEAIGDISGATSSPASGHWRATTLRSPRASSADSPPSRAADRAARFLHADAGTFDLSAKAASTDAFDMTALANGGTTLIGNNGADEVLTASASGNDTLESGTGFLDTLIAGGGNDTLVAGGDFATLIGGAGTDAFVLHNPLLAFDTVEGFTGADTIDLIGATFGTATASLLSGNVLQVSEGGSNLRDTTLSPGLRYNAADFALANDGSGNTEVSLVTTATTTVSAATASTDIDTYETDALASTLGTVALSDSGIPTLTITATQLAADADALNSIVTPYTLAVTGVSAANAATVAAMTGVVSVAVSDSAANVASNFDALGTLADEGVLASVALTDSGTPTLGVTTTQAQTDAAVFSLITTPFDVALGSDTTAAFVSDGDGVLLEGSGNDITFLGDGSSAGEWNGGEQLYASGR